MHLRGLRPEGPARPHGTWHPSRGGVSAQALAQADGTRSKALVFLLKGGTYLETPRNTIRLARCKCPSNQSRTGARKWQGEWAIHPLAEAEGLSGLISVTWAQYMR